MSGEPFAALSNAAFSRTVLLAPTATMCRHDFLIAYSCECRWSDFKSNAYKKLPTNVILAGMALT